MPYSTSNALEAYVSIRRLEDLKGLLYVGEEFRASNRLEDPIRYRKGKIRNPNVRPCKMLLQNLAVLPKDMDPLSDP